MTFKYNPPQQTITFAGGEFTIRGLALVDVTQLIATHKDTISGVFDQFAGRRADQIQGSEMLGAALGLVEHSPALAAHVIALSSDSPESFDEIKKLPVDVQVEAIEKIAAMTFAMEGGSKKFWETVIRLSKATNKALQASTNGSGVSAVR